MAPILVLALLLLAEAGCVARPHSRPWRKAARICGASQADDGGWHSHTYGLLRSGQSLTPFVLDALLAGSGAGLSRAGREKSIAPSPSFAANTRPDGALGMTDPRHSGLSELLDRARRERALPGAPAGLEAAGRADGCLSARAAVHGTERLAAAKIRAYGAWGMGGDRRTPPDTGHVDLSMTRYVLDALRAAGVAADPIRSSQRARDLRRALPELRSAASGRRRWRLLLFHHRVRHQQGRPRRQPLSQLRHHHRRWHSGAAGHGVRSPPTPRVSCRAKMADHAPSRHGCARVSSGDAYRALAARPGLLLLGGLQQRHFASWARGRRCSVAEGLARIAAPRRILGESGEPGEGRRSADRDGVCGRGVIRLHGPTGAVAESAFHRPRRHPGRR